MLDKEAASTSDDQKQAPASATTIHDDQRKWQQRAIVLYVRICVDT